jgi:hypothetical protein
MLAGIQGPRIRWLNEIARDHVTDHYDRSGCCI